MDFKDGKTEYGIVPTVEPVLMEDYSLEEILAEYGGSREQQIMRDVERQVQEESGDPAPTAPPQEYAAEAETPAETEPPAEPVRPEKKLRRPKKAAKEAPDAEKDEKQADGKRQEARDKLLAQAVDLEKLEREIPSPRPITLTDVVESTVDAVMEEREEVLLKPKRGLFSRRKLEDTEQLYGAADREAEPEPDPEPIGLEKELSVCAAEQREAYRRRKRRLVPAIAVALLPTAALVTEYYGVEIPYWSGDLHFQGAVLLGCLLLTALLCRSVFGKAVRVLSKKRCVSEVLISVATLVTAGDCIACMTLAGRTAVQPYAAVACLALVFAQWGICRETRGMFDTYRTAAVDEEPPYLVTDTIRGACKQQGCVRGFYTISMRDDFSVTAQTVFLPIVLVASLVFAGITSLGKGYGADFLLHWSGILSAGATFALPLCWALPWAKLAKHLQKAGCAVAGWSGAEKISRRRSMILTDMDLFPPGTVRLICVKVYGEEMRKVASYAATMARAAGSGLERLFDRFLRGESASYETVHSFNFYEEGGWGGTVRGESVLMGTASFMRKMDVRLPGDINLKTGVFLAVDRQLVAVFAVKYNAAENVDFALRMMRRSHIMPILASRDPNITPPLLRRKFSKGVKVEYPSLTGRVALSEAERDRDLPRALLQREGLLPYAEAVAGSRRMCKAVRRAVVLSLCGSVAGLLLSAYLLSLQAFTLLTPMALEVFLLLWVLPVLLMTDWTGRY